MQGITQIALSAVDIAVWDILGKAAGMPVYKMLGAVRDRMPAYAMCGWYWENDKDHSQYKRTINETLEQGYRAFKVKVGRYGLDDDVERIEVGQKTAGKDIKVMVDANQVYTRVEALRRGKTSINNWAASGSKNRCHPTIVDGFAELTQALDMRVATGENLYNKHAFSGFCCSGTARIVVQPDNRRAGGPTEWMEIGAISDGFGLELASHGGGAVNMNILCAIPNAIYMETSGPQKMVKGEAVRARDPRYEQRTSPTIRKYKKSNPPVSSMCLPEVSRFASGTGLRPLA